MKNITLSISGGGIRSAAALGVINYLDQNNYNITAVSGSSAGSVIAFLLAAGYNHDQIAQFILNIDKWKLLRPTTKSFLSLSVLEKELKRLNIKSFKKRLFVCTTNIKSGQPVYFDSEVHNVDLMIKAVVASCTLIPLFKPIEYMNMLLADGGYTDNLPNIMFKDTYNISINVNNVDTTNFSYRPLKLSGRLFLTVMNSNVNAAAKRSKIYINVDTLENINLFDFKKIYSIIEYGYRKAKEILD